VYVTLLSLRWAGLIVCVGKAAIADIGREIFGRQANFKLARNKVCSLSD
jgi:hypothetical protein